MEKTYALDCLESTWISSNGKYIKLFESNFAEYVGVKHALSCCNGTVAIHLALLALGIGPGDEVIVPTLTYVATANAVNYTGATPVLAGAEPETWNMDTDSLESLITPRTKAIIPVHLYGHPCDMDVILDIASRHNIYVVEDAAEALGSQYKGKMCGAMADVSTFSFYGNKTITTGEGGMVVTSSDDFAEKIRLFKGQGMDASRRYWFPMIGYNYRMTNIEAAIGLAQLENINKFIERRRTIARWYNKHLRGISGITLPLEKNYAFHSYWMFTILIEQEFGKSRDEVMDMFQKNGVETRPVFYPMHIMPVYKEDSARLLYAATVASKGINLPTFYDLQEQDIDFIASLLKKI